MITVYLVVDSNMEDSDDAFHRRVEGFEGKTKLNCLK